MRSLTTRGLALAAAVVAMAIAPAAPGTAQDPAKTETITYEALADGSGVSITLSPGGAQSAKQGGALTTGTVDQKPSAKGAGEGITGQADSTATTAAPPDGPAQDNTAPPPPVMGAANVGTIAAEGGRATSGSEAKDGSPSTKSTAEFGKSIITAGTDAVLGFTIEMGGMATEASASATKKGKDVSSSSSSAPVTLKVSVSAAALAALPNLGDIEEQLCTGLAAVNDALSGPCATLFDATEGLVTFATIQIGEGTVACTWDGETPKVTGKGAGVSINLLGVDLPELSQGQATTLGADTPLEMTIGAGAFSSTVEDGGANQPDSVTGLAGGAFADLFGKQAQFRFSSSSASIEAQITTDEVLAATGGSPLLPIAGGVVLVAAAIGLRQALRRRDEHPV